MTYRGDLLPKLQNANQLQGMVEILSGLYIGNFRDSKDAKQLDIHRITHILSIHDEARKLFKDKKYLIICAADSPKQDLMQFVHSCNDFIHAARLRGGHVLVHCLAGISRSVTIVAAYIISVTGLSVAEALQAVRSTRTIANPNFGFQKQLYDYFEVNAGARKEQQRLSQLFNKSINASPVVIPGRLIQRQSTLTCGGDPNNLLERDQKQLEILLQKYRRLVELGELCAGDCPNDGVTCPSGVCRAHLRSIQSYSFLRRGASANTSARNKPHMNLWCPEPPITSASNSTPSTPVKQQLIRQRHLPRNRSEHSLPSTPAPLHRCFSDSSKFSSFGGQNQRFLSPTTAASPVSQSPSRSLASPERLSVPPDSPCVKKDPQKVSWGTTVTTIRATRRFSHHRATPPAIGGNGNAVEAVVDIPTCVVSSPQSSTRYDQLDVMMQ